MHSPQAAEGTNENVEQMKIAMSIELPCRREGVEARVVREALDETVESCSKEERKKFFVEFLSLKSCHLDISEATSF
jgi:hypothetical protein